MKTKDIVALFLLAALWGASFLFMRIASPVLGPFFTIEIRVLIAGLALFLYSKLIKHEFNFKSLWKKYLILGTFNAAVPFTLISTATLTLDASLASILNATTPLFAVVVAAIWLKEKITYKKTIGIVIGLSGVIILLGWSPIVLSPKVIFSATLSILAAVSYGFGGAYAKKAFEGVDSLSLAIGQQLAAALVLMPLALTKIPSGPISSSVIVSVVGLAIFCTSLAYILYFNLIANVGPAKTLTVTFLVPVFGVIWGIVFLNENVTPGMLVGLVIILSSISIMNDVRIKRAKQVKTQS